MEGTTLNMILVFSFLFVSVALGIKWLGEIIIKIVLCKQEKEQLEKIFAALEEDEYEER